MCSWTRHPNPAPIQVHVWTRHHKTKNIVLISFLNFLCVLHPDCKVRNDLIECTNYVYVCLCACWILHVILAVTSLLEHCGERFQSTRYSPKQIHLTTPTEISILNVVFFTTQQMLQADFPHKESPPNNALLGLPGCGTLKFPSLRNSRWCEFDGPSLKWACVKYTEINCYYIFRDVCINRALLAHHSCPQTCLLCAIWFIALWLLAASGGGGWL